MTIFLFSWLWIDLFSWNDFTTCRCELWLIIILVYEQDFIRQNNTDIPLTSQKEPHDFCIRTVMSLFVMSSQPGFDRGTMPLKLTLLFVKLGDRWIVDRRSPPLRAVLSDILANPTQNEQTIVCPQFFLCPLGVDRCPFPKGYVLEVKFLLRLEINCELQVKSLCLVVWHETVNFSSHPAMQI